MSTISLIADQGIYYLEWQDMRYRIDFLSAKQRYRCHHAQSTNELLARAIGLRGARQPLRIIDATTGLGSDALVLAALGCQVTMLERRSEIARLLRQALDYAQKDHRMHAIAVRMSLLETESRDFLKQPNIAVKFDTIYIDPMFPPRKKRARVKKGMQMLQTLLAGEEQNGDLLAQTGIDCGIRRVVVKRPAQGAALKLSKAPDITMKAKTCRFDIYIQHKLVFN